MAGDTEEVIKPPLEVGNLADGFYEGCCRLAAGIANHPCSPELRQAIGQDRIE
jgi:hypothetical protein